MISNRVAVSGRVCFVFDACTPETHALRTRAPDAAHAVAGSSGCASWRGGVMRGGVKCDEGDGRAAMSAHARGHAAAARRVRRAGRVRRRRNTQRGSEREREREKENERQRRSGATNRCRWLVLQPCGYGNLTAVRSGGHVRPRRFVRLSRPAGKPLGRADSESRHRAGEDLEADCSQRLDCINPPHNPSSRGSRNRNCAAK